MPKPRSLPQSLSAIFVWCVFVALLAGQLLYVRAYGVNCFYYDEWVDSVRRLSGAEPATPAWLWSPHNEHRIPLPRLLFLSSYTLAGDDVRGAMTLNVLLLAAAAAVLLLHVFRLRGGRWSAADAFLPLALLGPAHYGNVLWGFQLQFTSCALLCAALIVLLVPPPGATMTTRRAAGAGAVLLLLPLTGSNGAAFVPFGAAWLAWRGVAALRAGGGDPAARKAGRLAVALAAAAVVLTAVYFVGIERIYSERPSASFALRQVLHLLSGAPGRGLVPAPDVAQPPPPLATVLGVGAAVLAALAAAGRRARAFGAVAAALAAGAAAALLLDRAEPGGPGRASREAFALGLVPVTLLLPALALLAAGLARGRRADRAAVADDRPALLGAAAVLLGVFGLIAVISVSRAGIGEFVGLAPRYTTLTVLALVCLYVVAVRAFDGAAAGRYVQWWSFGLAALCLGGNVAMARAKGEERRLLLDGFLSAVRARTPIGALSAAYAPELANRPEALALGIAALRSVRSAPYDAVPDDPAGVAAARLDPAAARVGGFRRAPDGLLEPAPGGGLMEWDLPAPAGAAASAPRLYLLRLRYSCPGRADAPEGAAPAYQVAVLAPGEAEPPVWPSVLTGVPASRLGSAGLESSLLGLPVRAEGAGVFFPNRPAASVRLAAAPGAPSFRLEEVSVFLARP